MKQSVKRVILLLTVAVLTVSAVGCQSSDVPFDTDTDAVATTADFTISMPEETEQETVIWPEEDDDGPYDYPHFELSREGKNVVVILLDRAMGQFLPYLINEKPELADMLDGFTYYSNTISFGGHTNFAAPPLLGGYEYTPVEMNRRDTETLKEKHNEALMVMPRLFLEAGYNVTVCDAPYANYKWDTDLSIYDEYPEMVTYITKGTFLTDEEGLVEKQTAEGLSKAEGMYDEFMKSFSVMQNLITMTKVKNGTENNFLFLYNDAPHEPMLLQTPDYVPSYWVDNTEYDSAHSGRFSLNGKSLSMISAWRMKHYHANMACLLKIGEWCDYLRQRGVYDNTKIIVVSDHGYNLKLSSELMYDITIGGEELSEDMGMYYPLMMVKDFDSRGFTVSDEFMTNADVPTLALKDVIEDPVNPFTGKPINSHEKTAHDQFITLSHVYSVNKNNGTTFQASGWVAVTNDVWNRSDWRFIADEIVLKEHKAP